MDSKQNQNIILKFSCIVSSLLKKWRTLFLVMLICGIGVDVIKTITYNPQYSSSLTAVLKLEENTYSQLEDARSYIKTVEYIFNSQIVKKQLNINDLNLLCTISSVNDTNIVNIQLIASQKQDAYHCLNKMIDWYQKNADQYHFTYDIDVLEKATLNENPINPNSHFNNFKKGFILSGIVVIGFFSIIAYMQDTIKVPGDIENKIDCRLFAKIPYEKKSKGKKFWKKNKSAILISSLKTSFFYKESIKKLRSRLESSANKHGYKTFLITSTFENEGKSSIAANLAISLAQNNHKVLLIDADIRKPSVHKIFELKTKKSLNAYLDEQKTWESQVDYIQKHNLFIMCTKQNLAYAEELTQSQKMKVLIEEARKDFDFVLIDTSPSYYLNEPLILNELVDASMIVVKQNEAQSRFVNETIYRIVNVKNNLIGCIYNASVFDMTKVHKTYGYRYGYNRYERIERRQ